MNNNHILALSNQKGGVGKTTLTRELDSTLYEALTGDSYQVQEVMPKIFCTEQKNVITMTNTLTPAS